MRVGFLGDIHGRDNWKDIISKNPSVHTWVFVGDYCDSFDKSNVEIIHNLKEIIELKKSKPDNIILLTGNHDLQYMHPIQGTSARFVCSGFRSESHFDLYELFRENLDLFKVAWQHGNVIATHAGIHQDWFTKEFKGDITIDIAEQLNNPNDKEQYSALFQVGNRRGGWYEVGGPMWCDENEMKKPLKGFTQVVGHTRVSDINLYQCDGSVYFIDCIEDDKFLILECV